MPILTMTTASTRRRAPRRTSPRLAQATFGVAKFEPPCQRPFDAAGFEHLLDAQAAAAAAMTTLAGAIKTYVGTREDHRSRMLLHATQRLADQAEPPPRRRPRSAHGPGRVRRRPRGAPPRARGGLGKLLRPGRRAAPRRGDRQRGESGADDRQRCRRDRVLPRSARRGRGRQPRASSSEEGLNHTTNYL